MALYIFSMLVVHMYSSSLPGNKYIHLLTQAGNSVLRIEVKFEGPLLNTYSYAVEYSHFSVGNSTTAYKLAVSGYSGTIGKHLNTLSYKLYNIFLYICLIHFAIPCIRVSNNLWRNSTIISFWHFYFLNNINTCLYIILFIQMSLHLRCL